MKKEDIDSFAKKITITPFVITLVGSLVIFVVFIFLFINIYEKKLTLIQKQIIENEKKVIKNDVLTIKEAIDKYRLMGYVLANSELKNVLNLALKNDKFIIKPQNINEIKKNLKSHFSKNFFFWVKSPILTYPDIKIIKEKISGKTFEFALYKNKKYLIQYKQLDKNTRFGIAFNEDIIKNAIKTTFFSFLDEYNKNKTSYVALGKIYSLKGPDQNGVFGEIIYMPPEFKKIIGKKLYLNKPDIKGNYYRKNYYKCFREHKGCFVKYYFKNPFTKKYEEKISFFELYEPFKWSIVKGEYISSMKRVFNIQRESLMKNMLDIFGKIFFRVMFVYLFLALIMYIIINKYVKTILKRYSKALYYDDLTSLPNRNKLLEDIKKFKSVIMIDIKDFTEINDVYGFATGDEILKSFARRLKLLYIENVYRVGSDEFVIGFGRKLTEEDFKKLFKYKKLKYDDIEVDLIAGGSNNKDRLLETSELALKEAYKENVKYKFYDEKIFIQQQERIEKLKKLKSVLEKEDIIPFYQCIVDKNGKTVKYEALMRIKIDENIQSPAFFMDLIKEARLYIAFSKLMLKKVFEDLKTIDKKVSINLSFEDIANKEMKEYILELLSDNIAKKIVFEILESESVKNYDILKDFIDEAKKRGAEIAIDDFGSGYSNFVNITKLNPDIIKIDGSIVKDIHIKKNRKLVELMVNFAHEFNLKTVAEFVSSKEIFEKLKEMGIDEYQGYYFCEPQPLEKIIKNDKIISDKPTA